MYARQSVLSRSSVTGWSGCQETAALVKSTEMQPGQTTHPQAARPAHSLIDEDRRLVDLVGRVLVDPNLHTDLRLRLHREIMELLDATREDSARTARGESADAPTRIHPDDPARLLETVLVDPNLHTDLRLRLHREIGELLAHRQDEPESRR